MTEVRVRHAEARVIVMTEVRIGSNASQHAVLTLIAIIVIPSFSMSRV